jgi:hypothetical protein
LFTSKNFDSVVDISPRIAKDQSPCREDLLYLTNLPMEVLCRIATFLDSFSLLNLSLTCWLLRDVCRRLVRHRGIVVQDWKRTVLDSKITWTTSHQRWLFTKAFDPIRSWQYTDKCGSISQHLKVCPFNTRHPWQVDRIPLLGLARVGDSCCDLDQIYEFTTSDMYCSLSREEQQEIYGDNKDFPPTSF